MRSPRRHFAFYVALAAALPAGVLALWLLPSLAAVVAANAFFTVYLMVTLAGLRALTPTYLKKHAASSDQYHLKVAFQRTGARNQAELVRRVTASLKDLADHRDAAGGDKTGGFG